MKQVEKKSKYILMSGDEEVIKTSSIQAIADHVGCQFSWIYANKYKDINKDGTWSFNTNNYNYTIKPIN